MFECSSLPQAAADAAKMFDTVIGIWGPAPVAILMFIALVFAARKIF